MQVILLEKVPNLGNLGEVVKVKDGFARNFLLPQGHAVEANDANRKWFISQKKKIDARVAQERESAVEAAGAEP